MLTRDNASKRLRMLIDLQSSDLERVWPKIEVMQCTHDRWKTVCTVRKTAGPPRNTKPVDPSSLYCAPRHIDCGPNEFRSRIPLGVNGRTCFVDRIELGNTRFLSNAYLFRPASQFLVGSAIAKVHKRQGRPLRSLQESDARRIDRRE